MSSTVTVRPVRGVRGIGSFAVIAGIVMIVAGILVWILVATQLAAEKITVADDAPFLGGIFQGDPVRGPLTAFAQADIINHHALDSTNGQTYAELAQDDPLREVVMTASFLRASLFTSVVSFGLCALVIALGLLFLLVGVALRKLANGPDVALAGAPAPALSSAVPSSLPSSAAPSSSPSSTGSALPGASGEGLGRHSGPTAAGSSAAGPAAADLPPSAITPDPGATPPRPAD